MIQHLACSGCGARFRAQPKAVAFQVACPKCRTPILVPAAEPTPAAPAIADDDVLNFLGPAPTPAAPVSAVPLETRSVAERAMEYESRVRAAAVAEKPAPPAATGKLRRFFSKCLYATIGLVAIAVGWAVFLAWCERAQFRHYSQPDQELAMRRARAAQAVAEVRSNIHVVNDPAKINRAIRSVCRVHGMQEAIDFVGPFKHTVSFGTDWVDGQVVLKKIDARVRLQVFANEDRLVEVWLEETPIYVRADAKEKLEF